MREPSKMGPREKRKQRDEVAALTALFFWTRERTAGGLPTRRGLSKQLHPLRSVSSAPPSRLIPSHLAGCVLLPQALPRGCLLHTHPWASSPHPPCGAPTARTSHRLPSLDQHDQLREPCTETGFPSKLELSGRMCAAHLKLSFR